MDDGNSKKIATSIFVVVLLLVGVLVGTVITRNLSNSQNTTTQASQMVVTSLEVISPVPGQTITGKTEVKAMTANTEDLQKLTAVFKVGDETGVPMSLSQQGDKVIMTGSLNPTDFPKGKNTLSIYLYKSDQGQANLIGSAVFYIQI